ncbi:MAG: transcriptional regulator [Planctomycetaceae bacterium]|nr:transcriptional regulator [Planctomycetaceae bacterium]
MSFPKRFQDQADNDLPLELQELGELISSLSGSESLQIQAAYKRVTESVLRRRRILGIVQEALSQLRLDVKYLMFDLEVTRRERDELQSRIEGEEREY